MKKKSRLRREDFLKNHPHCCYCGGAKRAETLDHAPPRIFFLEKHRPRGLEVPACQKCNRTFSKYDDFISFLSILMRDSVNPEKESRISASRARSILKRFPNSFDDSQVLEPKTHLQKNGLIFEGVKLKIAPEMDFAVNLFTARMALAVYYDLTKKIAKAGTRIETFWQTNLQQFQKGLPQPILDLLSEVRTLDQGKWSVADQFEYGFSIEESTGLGVILFSFHNSFHSGAFLFGENMPPRIPKRHALFTVTEEGMERLNSGVLRFSDD